MVCTEGPQLVLATDLIETSADAQSFAATILRMRDIVGLPQTVLADAGYACGPAIKALKANMVEPLVAIGRIQPHRPDDFRPPPDAKLPRRITAP